MKYNQIDEESTDEVPTSPPISLTSPTEQRKDQTSPLGEPKIEGFPAKSKRKLLMGLSLLILLSIGTMIYHVLRPQKKLILNYDDLFDPNFLDRKSLTIGSVDIDAGSRILQKILCLSPHQKKSFCYNRFPAEVISDFATVTIIYSPWDPADLPLLYNYTQSFQDYVKSFGITACLLETIFSNQSYVLTVPNNEPYHVQKKNNQLFYKRENLLNVLIKQLLRDTELQFFAWIDAHQSFANSYWWEEAIVKASKNNAIVQLFQTARYCDHKNVTSLTGVSITYEFVLLDNFNDTLLWPFWGNAWAISRDTYEKIGYIYDEGIGGFTDVILAISAKHNNHIPWESYKQDVYLRNAIPWMEKVVPIFNDSGSYIRGGLTHFEHERNLPYRTVMNYVRRNFVNKTLLDVLHRQEDFQLILDDPKYGTRKN